jgi:hypothetical protein
MMASLNRVEDTQGEKMRKVMRILGMALKGLWIHLKEK